MNIRNYRGKWIWLLPLVVLSNCKTPYDPQIKTSKDHYLVVEGFINPDGVTNIKLSRTRNITWGDTAAYINEANAKVIIEDDRNSVYSLFDMGGGNYSGNYYLDANAKYRLHIFTDDNREYLSDFVPCKISPPIQQVGWKFNNNGDVQIFVNTEDPTNNTRFYRWDYTETWEFHSEYISGFIYDPVTNKVLPRTVPVFICYRTRNASNVILGSSLKLKDDVIHEAPVTLIPNHDKRISVLYSTIVTQYALDSAGYNYWNALKGNTENVGSIFDPQPNQTKGNLHCITDTTEKVIGYIGAGTTDHQRIFISNSSMPDDWNLVPNCTEYDVPVDSLKFYFGQGMYIPYKADPDGDPFPKAYFSASASCVDCTLSGSPVKPTFWP
ncbi:MAG TPA: DUF4249 domain-containing protein [Hanamia sp.]|nr:DUF4249 domain-containing protein [Hanamia sp.]